MYLSSNIQLKIKVSVVMRTVDISIIHVYCAVFLWICIITKEYEVIEGILECHSESLEG